MLYNADVTLTLNIQYYDIEADSEEEARAIACERAYEDVDWNNCDCSDDANAFVWTDEE